MSDLPKRLSQKAVIPAPLGRDTACILETIKEHIYENIYYIHINFTCGQGTSFLNEDNVIVLDKVINLGSLCVIIRNFCNVT